ncbi:MAG TPA: helix-turn-helix domain-containing protein [Gammaproteobacteria bacterium]
MLIVAWGLNIAAVSILVHLALNLLFSHGKQRQARYLAAFLLGIACYSQHSFFRWEVFSSPENQTLFLFFDLDQNGAYWAHFGLWLIAESVPWTLWAFLRLVCRDNKDSFPVLFAPFVFVLIANVYVVCTRFNAPFVLHFSNGVNLLLLFMGLYELLHDIQSDLSNSRRRFRNIVIMILLTQILVIFYMEVSEPMWKNLGWLFGTRLVVLASSLFVSLLYFQASAEAISEIFYCGRGKPAKSRKALSRDAGKLIGLLETETLYKDPDLSVAFLAKRMEIPEYKLRDLIRNELGFRNFNAFINKFRIEHAVKRFQEDSDTPVAVIQLDSGFKCHPPFNRAFREIHGVSPGEYRNRLKKRITTMQPSYPKTK